MTDRGSIRGLSVRPSWGSKILLSFQMKYLLLREKMGGRTRCGPKLTRKTTSSSMDNGVGVTNLPFIELPLTTPIVQVHQIPFAWDLAMSTKLDAHGTVIGSYETDDLTTLLWPEEKRKGKRRVKRRYLEHELVWSITEMQVKTFVRAIFPNPPGPLTMQLAKERPLGPQELTYGESRSQALVKDIQVSARVAARATPVARPRQLIENGRNGEQEVEQDQRLEDILGSSGRQLVNDLANEYQQPREEAARMIDHVETARPVAQMTSGRHIPQQTHTAEPLGIPSLSRSTPQGGPSPIDETAEVGSMLEVIYCKIKSSVQVMTRSILQPTQASSSNPKMDGRRRDG